MSTGLKGKTVTNKFTHYARRAGLDFHLHSLRHTFATKAAAQGDDIRIISELLGHKDIRVSLTYSKVDSTRLKGVVDRIGDSLATLAPDARENDEPRMN